ncbi:YjbH domain-containing protein [Ponticoccus sp. SC2-23]|uniref:YjbH domain-containing protein n=1 Tax=Alexandriicola marinus TaxID=2081710 RepID=UPI000FD80BEE|nr:YjbH domain-containing protein [Alexandriicola marinus]MBM1221849.1 YjbH domain-containing protein [Ponticoccus sp. SC6-9]MBM1226200.1 YjbH domain-containing protein [Ponticoccus sp. SC6-15]MBM1230796.1 YjbH domain-containing protein [Ponticoccus sp. SC6-38]MBM1235363.1 YjbH domain-containing protein [Ponticoccus sp. SC6-45]MBM1239818.1 YjbH domain-containing protein [Ponticoccus sp. SC6-49]MBM1243962.1 YjbH domain-containing protein [Ponticoccus sp. SC2-64]MBM1248887.1 YjbH domain-contai
MAQRAIGAGAAISLIAVLASGGAQAQDRGITYTLYGTPGLLEMPTALVPPDGEFAATLGATTTMQRTTMTFQITPRLMGSFRLSTTQDFYLPYEDPQEGLYVDRSVDLRYQILEEGPLLPSVSVGLQDFIASGQFGAEYIVASKALGDAFRVTAGLGWGRFGSGNGFDNPLGLLSSEFETRPDDTDAIYDGQWFTGDAAFFGGVEWAATDTLTLKAEYSSDAFERETALGIITIDSPINAGVTWEPKPGYQIAANYLYGNTFGLTGTILFNPNNRPFDGGFDPAPVPVAQRDAGAGAGGWDRAADPEAAIIAATSRALAAEGIELNAIQLNAGAARIQFTNNRYRSEAQALGRVARIMTRTLPASVETIILEPLARGIPTSAVTFNRSDLEALETVSGGSDAILERAMIAEAGSSAGLTPVAAPGGPLTWGIAPYGAVQFGDGENSSFGINGGIEASAAYEIRPNLVLSGALRQQLFNTADATTELPSDDLQRVRTNSAFYVQEGTTTIPTLTLSHYGRPLPELYSRVTAGLLEPMFGGVSTELLFKPVDSDWAVGGEVAYVRQREFDQLFEFQDYEVITGHGSVYYDFDNGFHGQLDVGRYLAGDWGATLAVDREFENGWRVGAFATVTDVSFDGEIDSGVDYGIRVEIPIDFVVGQPTQRTLGTTLGAPERDDGQRLDLDGRLYEEIRDGHYTNLSEGWGRFWR